MMRLLPQPAQCLRSGRLTLSGLALLTRVTDVWGGKRYLSKPPPGPRPLACCFTPGMRLGRKHEQMKY